MIVLRPDSGSGQAPRREAPALAAAVQESVLVGIDHVGHSAGTGRASTDVRSSGARAGWMFSASQARGVRGVEVAVALRSDENDGAPALIIIAGEGPGYALVRQ